MKFNGVRFTNAALLALVLILTLSGVYGLFWTESSWLFTLHRVSGWGLLALLPWKAAIIVRSLRRRAGQGNTGWVAVSLFLAGLTVVVLALGLLWRGRFGPADYPLRQTAVSWHWMLALGLLLPFVVHVANRWVRPRRADFLSRRSFMRYALIGPLAALGYLGYRQAARLRQHPAEPVRYTGSRRAGWYSGNDFPLTHNRAPQADQIDAAAWRLEVDGGGGRPLRLDYAALTGLPASELDATLDCTLGWYARQVWRGVWLVDLLAQAGTAFEPGSVRLVSVTGYAHELPWAEARQVLLATHVGGETLSAGHGFPLRAVVPTRRGWFWVKWLARIEAVP
ncbi:MAG TPA: molybdopterin-dependent oxidoreductase [Anaerolineaceae bacterium]|nr:molybdopterin-dependent oxidoreductase [Anaerolineaceae bacterium]